MADASDPRPVRGGRSAGCASALRPSRKKVACTHSCLQRIQHLRRGCRPGAVVEGEHQFLCGRAAVSAGNSLRPTRGVDAGVDLEHAGGAERVRHCPGHDCRGGGQRNEGREHRDGKFCKSSVQFTSLIVCPDLCGDANKRRGTQSHRRSRHGQKKNQNLAARRRRRHPQAVFRPRGQGHRDRRRRDRLRRLVGGLHESDLGAVVEALDPNSARVWSNSWASISISPR